MPLPTSLDPSIPAWLGGGMLGQQWLCYWRDAMQRQVLLLGTLRRRGNTFLEHEAAGMPPVLDFAYVVVVDGSMLPRPFNYQLLRVHPPDGPNIEAGNMLAKQLTFVSMALTAGLVVGAKVPVMLTSRADDDRARLASCALALLAEHFTRTGRSAVPALQATETAT